MEAVVLLAVELVVGRTTLDVGRAFDIVFDSGRHGRECEAAVVVEGAWADDRCE